MRAGLSNLAGPERYDRPTMVLETIILPIETKDPFYSRLFYSETAVILWNHPEFGYQVAMDTTVAAKAPTTLRVGTVRIELTCNQLHFRLRIRERWYVPIK